MSMDHVQLARSLWVWFGYSISPSSEPGADTRVDALAAKLEQWLPALPYEPLRGDYIEQIAQAQGWDVDDKGVVDDLDRFARTIEQAHGICITNMAGGGKAARYEGHNLKVGEIGPANLPHLCDCQEAGQLCARALGPNVLVSGADRRPLDQRVMGPVPKREDL